MGYILLEGGAEFGGEMAVPDRRALELAGALDGLISIIPTAAAPDNNHQNAGQNGKRWFESLGASRVVLLPLIDRVSANDPAIVDVQRYEVLLVRAADTLLRPLGLPESITRSQVLSNTYQQELPFINNPKPDLQTIDNDAPKLNPHKRLPQIEFPSLPVRDLPIPKHSDHQTQYASKHP